MKNLQLDSYTRKLKIFSDNILQVEEIARELRMTNSAKNVKELLSNLKNDSFQLVVVGEFSRGKSTFINALLGEKILPAKSRPTTAIISKIVYGDEPKYSIFYKKEKQLEIFSREEFLSIVAPFEVDESDLEAVQEMDRKQRMVNVIDHAEISYPLQFCRDNVEIVDTPGTNDLNVRRMEITYGYLNQADACVLVLTANQPVTKSEKEFLQERILGNKIQDIFFVVTHKSACHGDPKVEERVENFARENLGKILPKNFKLDDRIFLVESRGALLYYKKARGEQLKSKDERSLPKTFEETGFPSFENSLGNFLANDKGNIKIRRYVDKAKNILATIQHDLLVNMEIVLHSTDEIRRKVASMQSKFEDVKRRADKVTRDMEFNFKNSGGNIEYKCRDAANSILEKARESVNDLSEDMPKEVMKNFIEKAVALRQKDFIEEVMKDFQEIFDREMIIASNALKNIWNDIEIQYRREFNLPATISNTQSLSLADIKMPVAGNKANKSDHSFGLIGAVAAYAVFGFLGAAVVGGISLYNHMQEENERVNWRDKILAEIQKTYGSLDQKLTSELTSQYNQGTAEICQNVRDKINARIDDMGNQLKNILREKESQEQDASSKRNYLAQKRNELQQIERTLNSLT